MRRTSTYDIIEPSSELEREFHRCLQKNLTQIEEEVEIEQTEEDMSDQKKMADFAKPSLDGTGPSITRPTVSAHHFEIKTNVIQMVQQTV